LTAKDTSDFAKSLVTQEQWDQLHETQNLDFAFGFQ